MTLTPAKAASSFLDEITVLILTYNEEPNIGRTLSRLQRFNEVVVLDSGSQDKTIKIAQSFPNVRVEHRVFDQHARQWNHGLENCSISRPWVLALDADFVVSDALLDEIAALPKSTASAGYRIGFRYCVHGHPLKGSLYPPLVALFRRDYAHYVQDGHTQRVVIEGPVGPLQGLIDHDDRKPLSRWLTSQQNYARLEAEHLLETAGNPRRFTDRIRLMAWPAPILVFFHTLILKRCLLDGWPGWLYVLQRTLAETMIAIAIIDRRLSRKSSG